MRLTCPICGERDRREFYYQGDAVAARRPAVDAGQAAWEEYLHLRDNPAGQTRDLWQHDGGCGSWLVVTRDTVDHSVSGVTVVGA